jgi:hypothetical protein
MCAVVAVIYGVSTLMRSSQLLVFTTCKWPINPTSNPNPVDSHSNAWRYYDTRLMYYPRSHLNVSVYTLHFIFLIYIIPILNGTSGIDQ